MDDSETYEPYVLLLVKTIPPPPPRRGDSFHELWIR